MIAHADGVIEYAQFVALHMSAIGTRGHKRRRFSCRYRGQSGHATGCATHASTATKARAMTVPKIDGDYAARQILAVFARYKVPVAGVLRRHQFFEVRDSDFQRGIDGAVASGWIQRHERDRYRYILTRAGREAFNTVLIPMTAAAGDGVAGPVQPQ